MKKILLLLFFFSAAGNADMKKTIHPVKNFNLNKYLGQWYEIARFDHIFERGLSKVTAEYSIRKDGKVSVLNQGFSESKNKWVSAKGKAVLNGKTDEGYLKVSFFGPFYSDYIIFELDEKNYQYALIGGSKSKKKYFWILSRKPVLDDKTLEFLLNKAEEYGFTRSNMIFVKQN